jgi:hypothetical protein
VTGAVSLTLTESPAPPAGRCDRGTSPHDPVTGTIAFQNGQQRYQLQLVSLPAGTFHFPGTDAAITFLSATDSAQQWGAGTAYADGSGTVTFSADLAHGTLDVTMTKNVPPDSPGSAPIHLQGAFSC